MDREHWLGSGKMMIHAITNSTLSRMLNDAYRAVHGACPCVGDCARVTDCCGGGCARRHGRGRDDDSEEVGAGKGVSVSGVRLVGRSCRVTRSREPRAPSYIVPGASCFGRLAGSPCAGR